MKVKINIKEIIDYREEAIATFIKNITIDDFMFLLETIDKLEEIVEDEEE